MTALTKRFAASYSTAIQQRIASGSFFDGAFPAGDSPASGTGQAIYKYAEGTVGGLFFWDANEPVICSQFHISLGGAADVSLYLVNLDPASILAGAPVPLANESILIEQATGATFVALDEARFKTVLLPGQALKLVTTSSSAKQIAQAIASLERTYIR